MTSSFKAACIQTNASPDIAANITAASKTARRARDAGADLILFPENVAMIDMDRDRQFAKAEPEQGHSALAAFQDLARDLEAWVLVGSLTVKLPNEMLANRSYLLDAAGAVIAAYDKIHMFDVNLSDGQDYRESAAFAPGTKAVLAKTPWGTLGLTICYDIRFPHLYRTLAQRGADFIATPAAFTQVSGDAHWHVLQRARAIETGCYVFAPAQCGTHDKGRETFGHSLIIDPWGTVLADGGDQPGFIIADIDPAKVLEARAKIPSLTHDRPYD